MKKFVNEDIKGVLEDYSVVPKKKHIKRIFNTSSNKWK